MHPLVRHSEKVIASITKKNLLPLLNGLNHFQSIFDEPIPLKLMNIYPVSASNLF